MFNLEQSIANWRQQMLAAGIKTPATLEELECHLREEIERQVKAGVSEQNAFKITVVQIGQARELKAEFSTAAGLFGFLGADKFTRANRILGALWLVWSLWGCIRLCQSIAFRDSSFGPEQFNGFLAVVSIILALYGVGVLGSILLLRGSKIGRNIIRAIAVLGAMVLIGGGFAFKSFSAFDIIAIPFHLITLWILFSPSFTNQKMAA